MSIRSFHTPTYLFESYGPGLQEVMIYYHRELTAAELAEVQEILEPLLRRRSHVATEQFFLSSAAFPEALASLKKQIG
jgi:hypothetical protein